MNEGLLNDIGAALELAQEMPHTIADVALSDFVRWKPLAERLAVAQHAQAESVAAAITQVAEMTGDSACLALANWIRANVLYLLDQPAAAIPYYNAAESSYFRRDEPLQVARLRIGKIGALTQLGHHHAALEQGQAAAALLKASSIESDQNRLAGLHDQIGVVSEFLGRYLESLDGYQQKYNHWQARLKAISPSAKNAEAGIAAEIELARASANIGIAKTRLGQFVEASAAFQSARNSLIRTALLAPDEPIWNDIARIDMNVAWLEMLRQSPSEQIADAFATAERSREQAAGTGTDLIFLDLLKATWQLSQSDTDVIGVDEQHLTELRAQCEASGLAYETGRANLLLGDWLLRQGQIERAHALYQQTLSAALERGEVELAHQAGLGCSRALQRAGDAAQAIELLKQTIHRIENVRHEITVSEFRAGFLEDKLVLYQELARLQLAQQNPILALQTIERAKARTLAEMLEYRQRPNALATQPETDQVSDLAMALQQTRSALAQGPQSAIEQQALEHRITELVRELERRTASPSSMSTPTLRLDALCATLPNNALILSYAVLQGQVWAFLINRSGLLGEPVCLGAAPNESTIRQQLTRVTAVGKLPLATAERWVAQHIHSAQMPLGAWYQQFIAPLAQHLQGYAHLIIAPDALLHHLPFACLWDAAHGQYLIEQHEIVIAPSLQAFALLESAYAPQTTWENKRQSLVVGYSCEGQLFHAVDEAHQVVALLKQALPTHHADLLIEKEATLERVAQLAPNAGLIYIATHGLFRPDAPQFSYLELAGSRLTTLDILGLSLDAATVVLSACETGLGRLTGNEMIGMVQAFLYAGAHTVVATHWQVNDQATGQLMRLFAKHLLVGQPAGAALAQAQRQLINAQSNQPTVNSLWRHPYYWGGIWLVGVG